MTSPPLLSGRSRIITSWPRTLLGLEVLVASAFSVTSVFFEREHALPLFLYAAFYPIAFVSAFVGLNAFRRSANRWCLLYPVASIALIPLVWLFAIHNFFRFMPE